MQMYRVVPITKRGIIDHMSNTAETSIYHSVYPHKHVSILYQFNVTHIQLLNTHN